MGFMSSCFKIQSDEEVFRVTGRRTLTGTQHNKMFFLAKHYRWFNQRANKEVSPLHLMRSFPIELKRKLDLFT
jgi:hypothetical protein